MSLRFVFVSLSLLALGCSSETPDDAGTAATTGGGGGGATGGGGGATGTGGNTTSTSATTTSTSDSSTSASTTGTGGAGGAGGTGGAGGAEDPCQDGMLDGAETGIDCGGGTCPLCGEGEGCASGADCLSDVCQSNVCLPSCTDVLQNNGETDVDCGGPNCAPCVVGQLCVADSDCASDLCSKSTGQCVPGPTSCQSPAQGAGPNCGIGGAEDCCASRVVPGGTFLRSYDTVTYTDASNPATVSPYRLDRFEVTVGRFRQFINAGLGSKVNAPAAGYGAHPWIPGSGWNVAWKNFLQTDVAATKAALNFCGNLTPTSWTDQPGLHENWPLNCVTFHEAFWFCAWDGGFLPTENEYMFAAAGGDEQRIYPWSVPPTNSAIDQTYAYYGIYDSPTDVGSRSPKGDGRWGQADLGGNVWEWTQDYYTLNGANWVYVNPCVDCIDTVANANDWRVTRGGGFNFDLSFVRVGFRNKDISVVRYNRGGFRCARTP